MGRNEDAIRNVTVTIGIRVPLNTYLKYKELDKERKERIKSWLIKMIDVLSKE